MRSVFSDKKAQMLGHSPGDFIHYKNFTDLLHPDDYEPTIKAMQDHLDGKIDKYEIHYRIKCADGTYKTFLDRGRIVERDGKDIKVAGIVIDVSGIKL